MNAFFNYISWKILDFCQRYSTYLKIVSICLQFLSHFIPSTFLDCLIILLALLTS